MGVALAGLLLSVASSEAQLDLTGGTVVGSLTAEQLTGFSPMSNKGVNDGSITTWVVSGADSDSSGLIFIYQVSNDGIPGDIQNVELTGFTGSEVLSAGAYSASDITDLSLLMGEQTPTGGDFSTALIGSDNVTFQGADLNGISYFLVVQTDASTFGGSYSQVEGPINSDRTFGAAGSIYTTAVPEASTIMAGALMLLPLGIGAVRAIRKDRRV